MTNKEAIASIQEFITDAEREIEQGSKLYPNGIPGTIIEPGWMVDLRYNIGMARKQLSRYEKLVEVVYGDWKANLEGWATPTGRKVGE